jgi:hypothetical protein
MGDELSLLFRLRGENAQLKATFAETQVAVNKLRQSFGPQLTQTVSLANKTFSDLGSNLNVFVGQRLPLVGGAFIRVTENLRNFGKEGANTEKAIAGVAKSIQSIATQSGKSVPQITSFLGQFIRIEGQAKRDSAAIDFFGASLGAKLIPQLEETGTALAGVAESSAVAGGGLVSLANPIGLVIIALAALTIGAGLAAKQIFDLAKSSAEFEGRMFDLAQQTGLAVETLSALEVVAKTTGGNLDSIAQAIVLFQRKLDDAQDPLSKTAEQFRKFNIATTDTESSLRQTFLALAAMPEGFAQTNAAAEFFGARGGKQVLAILKETNGDIDGTIKHLRELGILITEDQARAADKFNDQLALLGFQLRALGAAAVEDVIPALVEIVKAFGDLVSAARPLISIFSTIAGAVARSLGEALKGLSIIVKALTHDYEGLTRAIKDFQDAQNIAPLQVPSLAPVPLPGQLSPQQSASEAINQADEILAAVKRNAAQTNQALSELFQKGRKDRQQESEGIIAENKKVLEAEQNRIDKLIEQKQLEIKSLDEASRNRGEAVNRDTEQYRAATAELTKLFQQRLDKENDFNVETKALRAKAAKDQADADREQAQAGTDALVRELDRRISIIDAANKRRAEIEPLTFADLGGLLQEERKDLEVIQALERAKLNLRLKGLEELKRIGNLSVEEQRRINIQIRQLGQEALESADQQSERRIEIALNEARRLAQIAQLAIDAETNRTDTILQVGQINDQARIASIRALAALRVKTEEQAERDILAVQLAAIDREKDAAEIAVEAIKARNAAEVEAIRARRQAVEVELQKTGGVEDKATRLREQTALTKEQQALVDAEIALLKRGNAEVEQAEKDRNNKTRVLDAQRIAIQADGNRAIDEGRQKDIENERRYVEAIVTLRRQVVEAQQDAARTVIDLMVLHFARRADIIRAQAKAEIDDENRRNKQAQDEIRLLRRDVAESNRTREEKLAALLEIDDLEETETERHRLALEEIRRRARLDEKNAEPLGRIGLDLDNLKEFARVLEDTVVPLGEILRNTFSQVADAIGQTVANWVLLGETGPAVMRKILAQALASIAAEAAVNAVKELALGFATLFFNPAESAAHFTAAGLWGSIAGATGLAGRRVAGDLFKSQSAGGGVGGSRSTGELNPLSLARNAGPGSPQQIAPQIQPLMRVEVNDSMFAKAIKFTIVDDINNAGPIREVLSNDGNLNRG